MEHRFFRLGSLVVIGLLIAHVAWIRTLPDDQQNEHGVLMILELFVIAILSGILFVTWILPSLGDKMTEAMIGSGEKVEATPRSAATAKIAAGDYAGAIVELEKQAQASPGDRYPVLEIARLYHDKLADLQSALQTVKTALVSRPWPPEDETIMRLRLADWMAESKDFAAAREQVESLIASYPGTPQAGAATTKLRELEEKEYLASRPS